MASPSSSRATKRRRSSTTEHSFQGIATSRRGPPSSLAESVTHVSGTFCHLCLGPLNSWKSISSFNTDENNSWYNSALICDPSSAIFSPWGVLADATVLVASRLPGLRHRTSLIPLRSRLASFIYRLPIPAFHTAHDRSCCRSRESARLREQPARGDARRQGRLRHTR